MTPDYRPDIDGLRAISILLVVTFHAFPGLLAGGYLGVDVFFVISGYLITGLVLRESGQGRFRLANFYARRVRRLFPALCVVTTACLVLGWFALLPDEYSLLGKHALGGALFVPNFVFWMEAGYWDTSSELKPLLHLWSLGVEEQFYLLWPGLLVLLATRGLPLWLWVAPVALASLAASACAGGSWPVATFFLPQFRIWELALGGLFYLWSRDRQGSEGRGGTAASRPAAWLPDVASLIGLALLSSAALAFDSESGPLAARVSVVAAATLLIVGAGMSAGVNRVLLANPAMVLLGRISYPFYLWHWPALSFARITESGTPAWQWRMGLLAGSVVLAWLTYRLVEMPLRRRPGPRVVAGLCAAYLAAGTFGGIVYLGKGFPHRTEALAAQLEAFEWESKGLYERDDCSVRLGVPGRCLSNGKPHEVAVVGDSYSTNTFFILQEVHRRDGKGVMRLGRLGCLPFYDVERYQSGLSMGCRDAMNGNLDYVLHDEKITTVVFSLRESLYIGNFAGFRIALADDPAQKRPMDVFRIAMERTVARFADAGKDVIFALGWPELDFDPKGCVDVRPLRLSRYTQKKCTIDRGAVDERSAPYRAMVMEVLAKSPRTRFWDPLEVLCDDRNCRARKDGVMIYRDDHHLSLIGSEYLGQHFVTEVPPGAQP